MDSAQARHEAERLNSESPEREAFFWIARERDGDWQVARVPKPARERFTATTADSPSRPDPSQDPPSEPNPFWGAG